MKKIFYLFIYLFAGSANAVIIKDFTGGYDLSSWTQLLNGGSVDTTGGLQELEMVSADSTTCCNLSITDFTATATGSGLVNFDWSYETDDVNASWDYFGWLLNGDFTQVTDDRSRSSIQLGAEVFSVVDGDIFGFSIISKDTFCGSATTIISVFSAPGSAIAGAVPNNSVSVPEPTSIALMGLGLVGLGFSQRRIAFLKTA